VSIAKCHTVHKIKVDLTTLFDLRV